MLALNGLHFSYADAVHIIRQNQMANAVEKTQMLVECRKVMAIMVPKHEFAVLCVPGGDFGTKGRH